MTISFGARLLAAALFACVIVPVAQAATVVPLPAGLDAGTTDADIAFNDLCKAKGGGNFGCETALVQFRGGDGTLTGDTQKELKIIKIDESGPEAVQQTNLEQDFRHVGGVARAFTITFDPTLAQNQLVLTFAGQTLRATETLNGFKSLILRVRGGTRGGLQMTDMVIDGTAIPDLAVAAAPVDSRAYLAVAGFDETKAFRFTGNATFDFQGTARPSSAVIFEAKFTDLELAPVPLPAAGLLLLGALGGFAALRRRRRA